MTKIRDCMLCHIDSNLILHEDDGFWVVLDPYPLSKGHVMIVSKQHYGCVAELDSDHLEEFSFLLNRIKQFYHARKVQVVFYEHGRAGSCLADGSDCHHLHFHCVPYVCESLISKISEDQWIGYNFKHWSEISQLSNSYGNYLLVEEEESSVFYPVQSRPLPSHYLRTLLANMLKKPELSNWQNLKQYHINALKMNTWNYAIF